METWCYACVHFNIIIKHNKVIIIKINIIIKNCFFIYFIHDFLIIDNYFNFKKY